MPKENVLKFVLADGSWIAIRQSGTEPKCKFYLGVVEETSKVASEKIERLQVAFNI